MGWTGIVLDAGRPEGASRSPMRFLSAEVHGDGSRKLVGEVTESISEQFGARFEQAAGNPKPMALANEIGDLTESELQAPVS